MSVLAQFHHREIDRVVVAFEEESDRVLRAPPPFHQVDPTTG